MGFSVGSITNTRQFLYKPLAFASHSRGGIGFDSDSTPTDPFEKAVDGLRDFVNQHGKRLANRPDCLIVGAGALGTPDLTKTIKQDGKDPKKNFEIRRSFDITLIDKPNRHWLSSTAALRQPEPVLILDVQDISTGTSAFYRRLTLYFDMRGQIDRIEERDSRTLLRARRPTIEEKWLLLEAHQQAQDYIQKQLDVAPQHGDLIPASPSRDTMAKHNPTASPPPASSSPPSPAPSPRRRRPSP